jgi:hypothetical protein
MTYRGVVQSGTIILHSGIELPDGLEVIVEPVHAGNGETPPLANEFALRNGVPVFSRTGSTDEMPDLDLVNRLRD